eukprot:CAMPEP_0204309674 /NCGR_PEP_ID=MMETSP0469-20131031/1238_1 /ASSEMBLY_ACC=CAM_ASM_000384 /TAXON_ID=2969 /ORGANISM="Oxyrrhis marina" /LENGTH=72 /DNA_ID=CAMNT_0051289323 /DNA_START=24 /DNA_END=242 /DNA_ORIENTATION=-
MKDFVRRFGPPGVAILAAPVIGWCAYRWDEVAGTLPRFSKKEPVDDFEKQLQAELEKTSFKQWGLDEKGNTK